MRSAARQYLTQRLRWGLLDGATCEGFHVFFCVSVTFYTCSGALKYFKYTFLKLRPELFFHEFNIKVKIIEGKSILLSLTVRKRFYAVCYDLKKNRN